MSFLLLRLRHHIRFGLFGSVSESFPQQGSARNHRRPAPSRQRNQALSFDRLLGLTRREGVNSGYGWVGFFR